ncbi:HpcH/HpaI aldolase/citrate lyase family protein [Curvibacter sp. PAE-UM]|uniref:HpcH/HpaI aldolase family protein n=1 Tax=Curvibacter sp. PAE-UM TaxID=1714344 RepID=UPI00070DAECB|nr:HpcH/HpaI aldolase/citrate lyase family protein [Curvibacter sp. PAE-UM]KRH99485.1 alpha-dehydro-beta-deoxy-D-glucarate aldolase [Curvibacter sp. PAE-UM]
MKTPVNPFKQAIAKQQAQIGLWVNLGHPVSTEICAGAGFDWLLLDAEHSPTTLPTLLSQLQTIAAYPGSHPIGRVPLGHGEAGTATIKQFLDLGFQTLLVPMVDTAEQAAALVQAMRYPPEGVRGMAGTRAARWGRYPNYGKEANEQVCLLVQAESRTALDNLDAIANTPGVDGVFIGPADLSASLGYIGQATHPEVQKAIDDAIRRIVKCGKAAGILISDETLARHYLAIGATFVAVGLDTQILVRQTSALAALYKGNVKPLAAGDKVY